MKKGGVCLSIVIVFVLIIVILNTNRNAKKFYLEDTYYGTNDMIEIKIDKLNQLIDNKESFAVFIYQPMCVTSSNFESVLSTFLEDKQISIYKIPFSNIKETDIGNFIKYYPSFIIYKEGKMVDFLEADKDEDIDFYISKEGFASWFAKYVEFRDNLSNED